MRHMENVRQSEQRDTLTWHTYLSECVFETSALKPVSPGELDLFDPLSHLRGGLADGA